MIDKGTMNGVALFNPVMTADGLVGYVSEVGMTYAKVITLLDVGVDVGAYNSATRDIGIVSGTAPLAEQGLCALEYLPRESAIKAGDVILTSGGSMFPRDIVIGVVRRVSPNSHGTSLTATVKPAADAAAVKDVFVITYFEGQGQE
jgi:rod shape-determining protein MreC